MDGEGPYTGSALSEEDAHHPNPFEVTSSPDHQPSQSPPAEPAVEPSAPALPEQPVKPAP